MSTRQIILELDEIDWDAIQNEFSKRQSRRDANGAILPDTGSNRAGAMIAEMIRDLNEYRELWKEENPPNEFRDSGDE